MRSLLFTALLAPLMAGAVGAQTLEESYAKLCSDPANAKSEACQILAKSLVAKLQGQQSAPASAQAMAVPAAVPHNPAPALVGLQRWRFLADLVDQELIDIQLENRSRIMFDQAILKYVWDEPGEVMGVLLKQADGTFKRGATLRWDPVRGGLVEASPGGDAGVLLEWQPDGSIVAVLGKTRMSFRRIDANTIEIRMEGDKGQGWELMNRRHRVKATPANIAGRAQTEAVFRQIEANSIETEKLMAEIQAADAMLKASPAWKQVEIARANKEAARRERAQNGGGGSQMFGAIMQGLAQGLAEVDTGGYAEAQANLDATVAGIQAAAAAEASGNTGRLTAPIAPTPTPSVDPIEDTYAPVISTPAETVADVSNSAAAPLRFILQIGLKTVVNGRNASCYSNILSIPGPPGWPSPSAQQGGTNPARALIEAYMPEFKAKCSAVAPLANGEPNYHWNLKGSEHISPESQRDFGQSHGFPFVQL